jgi:hypothetical protein
MNTDPELLFSFECLSLSGDNYLLAEDLSEENTEE